MTTVTSFAKDFSRICGLLLVASAGLVSCSENDTPLPVESDSKNIDYSAANAAGWHNYSVRVGQLLANDSKTFIMRGKVAITEGGIQEYVQKPRISLHEPNRLHRGDS